MDIRAWHCAHLPPTPFLHTRQEDAASSSGGSASAAELMGSYREAQRSSTSIPLLRSLEGLRAEGPALDSHLASADGAVLAQGSHALVPSVAAALGRAGGGGSASAAVRQAGAPSKQTPGGRGSDDELVERERELLQRVRPGCSGEVSGSEGTTSFLRVAWVKNFIKFFPLHWQQAAGKPAPCDS